MRHYFIAVIIIMLATLACGEHKSEFDLLLEETMQIHDEDMKRMGELISLKSQLKKKIRDANPVELVTLKTVLDELEIAEREMMQWMRNFAREFPEGAMSHEGMNHAEMDHTSAEHANHPMHATTPLSDLDRLRAERKTMDAMRIIFNQSLDQAKNILDKNSDQQND